MRDFVDEGRIAGRRMALNAERLAKQTTGIGATAADGLRRGLTDGEVLDLVLAAHPGAKTTWRSVVCYRAWLRSVGEPVPTSAEAERRRDALRRAQGFVVVDPARPSVRRRLPGRIALSMLD
jgi:hypothetical protein